MSLARGGGDDHGGGGDLHGGNGGASRVPGCP